MHANTSPVPQCPRERILYLSAQQLSDVELLGQLLGEESTPAGSTDLATRLLQRFGSISQVVSAHPRDLCAQRGLGWAKIARLRAAPELARRATMSRMQQGDVLSSPASTRQFLTLHLGGYQREVFSCVFVNAQHALICCEDLFFGTLDGAAVYPREVAVRALHHRAAAVILAHNHPSGVAEPSAADRRITERLQAALGLLDIRVLDHFIIGRGQPFSFAESGLL